MIPAVATSRAAPRTVGLQTQQKRLDSLLSDIAFTCLQKPIEIRVELAQETRRIADIIDEPNRYQYKNHPKIK